MKCPKCDWTGNQNDFEKGCPVCEREEFFEVLDIENCGISGAMDFIEEIMNRSDSERPIYLTQSQDRIYVFCSNIPITSERIRQWVREDFANQDDTNLSTHDCGPECCGGQLRENEDHKL